MKDPSRKCLALALSVLVVGLAACGDDSPTQSGDSLTEAEAQVMMEALVQAGGLGFGFLGAGLAPQDDVAENTILEIDETVGCPGGGTVRVAGSLTIDDEAENINWNFTQTHQNCQSTAGSDGSIWTFSGAPSVTTAFTAQVVGEQFNMNGSQQGGIGWSSGGQSGTCQINVNYSFSGNGNSYSGSVSGSVCGHSVSQSIQVTG